MQLYFTVVLHPCILMHSVLTLLYPHTLTSSHSHTYPHIHTLNLSHSHTRTQTFNSEVNSGFFYKSATDREKLVAAERKFVDDKVQQVIDLKKKVHCLCYMLRSERRACVYQQPHSHAICNSIPVFMPSFPSITFCSFPSILVLWILDFLQHEYSNCRV